MSWMDTPQLAWSDRLYRRLLGYYPPAFRTRFAGEMAQVFRSLCRAQYAEAGISGLAWLWLGVLWDWTWTVLAQWGQLLLKRRSEMTQTSILNRSDGVPALPVRDTILAVLPFLLFGLSTLAEKLGLHLSYSANPPLWQVLTGHPFLLFNWLVLVGLLVSLLKGFPRWGYAYLAWAILFGWWWSDMGSYGYHFGGEMWLPLLGVMVLALLLRRSIQPLRTLAAGLWKEWTLLSFAIYVLYAHMFMLFDSVHNPHLPALIIATTLGLGLGAWGYFRAASPLRRVLALMGGLGLAILISILDGIAYSNLAQGTPDPNLVGVIFVFVLSLLMLGNGLLALWRSKKQERAVP
ncbi:MAG TPA: hypothetical protein PKM21_11785 [Anaerolineales bacterium]|nr:hypothetical protein [Anaerolineales bacterium]